MTENELDEALNRECPSILDFLQSMPKTDAAPYRLELAGLCAVMRQQGREEILAKAKQSNN